MVKVIQGNLPGQRAEGYHQYRGGFEKGEGFGVRRTIPTSNTQTKGDTLAQKRQKEDFGLASKIYSGWDILQKDFFTRGGIVNITHDKQGKPIRRYLRGARWAIHDITTKLNSPSSPYPSPLGFCICGVDLKGEPAPGFTLNITTNALRDFTYSEENYKDGCFQPSSLSPLYEPYHLTVGERDYGWKTAEEIHQITTLCVSHLAPSWYEKDTIYGGFYYDHQLYTFDFAALGIADKDEVDVAIRTHCELELPKFCWWITYYRNHTHYLYSLYLDAPDVINDIHEIKIKDGEDIWRVMGVGSEIMHNPGLMHECYVAIKNI